MTQALIIGTHGSMAEQLVKTAEMIIGVQENVEFIDFLPGENGETLIAKYNEKLDKMDTNDGVLFLVDLFGGSPFNAASRIAMDKSNYDVITGVNVPMILETLLTRDNSTFDTLVSTALEAGISGVKSLKMSLTETEESEEEL